MVIMWQGLNLWHWWLMWVVVDTAAGLYGNGVGAYVGRFEEGLLGNSPELLPHRHPELLSEECLPSPVAEFLAF